MATTVTKYAGAGSNDSSDGVYAWTLPQNITSSDNAYAYVERGFSTYTQLLKASNFGFDIPDGATIKGIAVNIEKSCFTEGSSSACYVTDTMVRLVTATGAFSSADKAKTASWPHLTDAVLTYGGAADIWGGSWSSADINSANFGVAIMAGITTTGPSTRARVDAISITVTYELGAPSPLANTKANIGGAWKQAVDGHVKIDGIWKPISSIHTKIDGVWKQA